MTNEWIKWDWSGENGPDFYPYEVEVDLMMKDGTIYLSQQPEEPVKHFEKVPGYMRAIAAGITLGE